MPLTDQARDVAAGTRPRTGFLFSGQSAEYAGMGVELHREHALFRAVIDRHADQFRRLTGVGPLDVFADPAAQTRAELLQPAIFMLQVALAEFWTSCGVWPDAVVGHSLGEYAAACVAGVFGVEEGLELVSARGRAFAAVPGAGRMVAVGGTNPAELERLVAAHSGMASVAAYNAPERIVVSGTDTAMGELAAECERRGWLTIPLETTHAFHSTLVAPAVPVLVAAAGRIRHQAPAVPLALNLTGGWAAGDELGAEYWGRQLTSPVRFMAGVRALMDDGCTVFLEVGPGRTLTTAGRAQSDGSELWLAGLSPRTPDSVTVLEHLNRLEEAGIPVDWVRYHAPFRATGRPDQPLAPRRIDRGVTPMTDYDLRKKLEAALRARAGQARTEHPVSYAQSSLLMLHQMDPDSASYNVALTARFTGGFDPAAFHGALQSLVGRHAALRTTFSRAGADDEDGPAGRQTVHGWLEPDFAELDAQQWTEGEIQGAVRAAYREPFALVTGSPLRVRTYRVAPGEAVVLLAAHHVVCDFWSLGTMLAELEQLYTAETERRPARLGGRNNPYSDFVAYQRELIADDRGARARAYWHTQLSGELESATWPRFDLDPADADGGGSLMVPIPADLAADVVALAKAEAVTPYVVLLTAFQILVGRYTGRRDVLVGSPFAGRTDPALADCVGNFMNPVVLRADLSDAVSFREQLGRTRRTVAEAFEHQDYPFELLVSELAPRRADGRNPIFQTMFIYQKSSRHPAHAALHVADEGASPAAWAGLTAVPFPLDKQDNQLELMLEIVHDGDRLVGVLKYRKSVFSAAAAGRAAEHYETLLRAAVAGPDRGVADLPILSEAGPGLDRHPVPVPIASDDSLAARFRQAAERYAHRTAVRCGGDELTYAELDELAGRWTARLRAEGVGPGGRVALLLEPSLDTVAAIVAVQRAQAASVVLDPSCPGEWCRTVIEDSGARVVLTQPDLAGLLDGAAVPVLVMPETELPPAGEPGELPRAGDVACTVYTSGPAGTPLGIDVEHGNVLTLLESMREHVVIDETAVGAFHPAGSDLSWWGTLLAGACLVVVPSAVARSADLFHTLLVEERVTHLVQTPSALQDLSAVVRRTGAERLALRHVISYGEPLPAPLARTVREWCGTLWNGYGPAETTAWVTAQPVRPEDCGGASVPVGFPLANARVHVLDEHGQPVPPEFTGELHIGGQCVSRGYVNQSQLTKERFLDSPLEPQGRLYRTGDLARVNTRGQLEILGRADNQVTISGQQVDRARLAAEFASEAARPGVAGGLSDHERRVTAVWQQVLQRQDIGHEDNFFDLGGNSMLLLQVYELLDGDAADPPLKGSELFRYPTVTSLAARLGRAAPAAAGASEGRDRDRTSGRRVRPADDTVRGARLRARERGGKNA